MNQIKSYREWRKLNESDNFDDIDLSGFDAWNLEDEDDNLMDTIGLGVDVGQYEINTDYYGTVTIDRIRDQYEEFGESYLEGMKYKDLLDQKIINQDIIDLFYKRHKLTLDLTKEAASYIDKQFDEDILEKASEYVKQQIDILIDIKSKLQNDSKLGRYLFKEEVGDHLKSSIIWQLDREIQNLPEFKVSQEERNNQNRLMREERIKHNSKN